MQKRNKIDNILDVRVRGGSKQYLVQWQNGRKEWCDQKQLKSEQAQQKIVLFEGERKIDGQLEEMEVDEIFMEDCGKPDDFQKFMNEVLKIPEKTQIHEPASTISTIVDKLKVEFVCLKNDTALYSVGLPNEIPHLMTSKQIKQKYPFQMLKFLEQQLFHLASQK